MVLDEFHLRKYITAMTCHLLDSAADAKAEPIRIIREGIETEFRRQCREILSCARAQGEKVRVLQGKKYILQNWGAGKTRFIKRTVRGCSAEGHVSHVLSSRMNSRPMDWNRTGADKMARLRAHYFNKGDMLDLIRSQPEIQEAKAAAGAEDVDILWSNALFQWENQHRQVYGKYFDAMRASIRSAAAKEAWFKARIWGFNYDILTTLLGQEYSDDERSKPDHVTGTSGSHLIPTVNLRYRFIKLNSKVERLVLLCF